MFLLRRPVARGVPPDLQPRQPDGPATKATNLMPRAVLQPGQHRVAPRAVTVAPQRARSTTSTSAE
eukprot:9109769-Pyramimonas_sp.AAC.1